MKFGHVVLLTNSVHCTCTCTMYAQYNDVNLICGVPYKRDVHVHSLLVYTYNCCGVRHVRDVRST